MYRPDIFGQTPPQYLWAVFHGVAKRWNLTPDEQKKLLTTDPQPVGAPAPSDFVAERIDLAKDCLLHTDLFFRGDLERSAKQIRSPSTRFNQLSSLEFTFLTPEEIRQRLPNGVSEPHLNMYWQDPKLASPHMGLEVVRAAVGRVSGGPYALPYPEGLVWTMRLIRQGKEPI